jgi:hypothetical protein
LTQLGVFHLNWEIARSAAGKRFIAGAMNVCQKARASQDESLDADTGNVGQEICPTALYTAFLEQLH